MWFFFQVNVNRGNFCIDKKHAFIYTLFNISADFNTSAFLRKIMRPRFFIEYEGLVSLGGVARGHLFLLTPHILLYGVQSFLFFYRLLRLGVLQMVRFALNSA